MIRKNKWLFTFYFLLTIAISYSVDWSPIYVSFLSAGKVKVIGTIEKFRSPCNEAARQNMRCTDTYRIKNELFSDNQEQDISLGLGILISETEIYCSNNASQKIIFGDANSGARALELLRTYQMVNIQTMNCKGDIIVNVWNPFSYMRSGYVGGPLTIGERNAASLVKRVIEFFTVDFYILIFAGLLSTILINIFILKRAIGRHETADTFQEYSAFWAIFSIVKSGIPEIALPLISSKLIYIRFSNFISTIAHLGPGISFISKDHKMPALLRITANKLVERKYLSLPIGLILFSIGICLSPIFAKWLGIMVSISCIINIFIGVTRKNLTYLFFGIFSFSEACKLFNVRFAPYESTTLVFASLIIFNEFIYKLQISARVIETLNWSKSLSIPKENNELLSLIKSFADRFGITQVTILIPNDDGSSSIYIQKKQKNWVSEKLFLERIPSVFSHVLTTRDTLWNIHDSSEFAFQLRKGAPQKPEYNSGQYFTILPITKDNAPIAALALTAYNAEYFTNNILKNELQSVIQLILPMIGECIWSENLSKSDEWYRACTETSEDIAKLYLTNNEFQSQSIELILKNISDVINKKMGFGVFVSRVNPISRAYENKVTAGFSELVSKMYATTQFFALQGNTQGPMPLAINRAKIVTVSEMGWLYSVLHPLSLEILKLSECRSAAAVPILSTKEENSLNKVWGLIWLESKNSGTFLPNHENGLKILASSVSAIISKIEISIRAQEALGGLVRKDIAEKLLNKLPVREEDHGYILTADIRGSTQIANELGANIWNAFTEWLRPAIDKLAEKHKLRLELIVWDAFFFTCSQQHENPDLINDFISFAKDMNSLLEIAFQQKFPDRQKPKSGSRARFCIEFGDITKDIQNGTWQIVGMAMAHVCKLESACKPLDGWFFTTDNLLPLNKPHWLVQDIISNNQKIAVYQNDMEFKSPSLEIIQLLTTEKKIDDAA